jgi:hypothetical protein
MYTAMPKLNKLQRKKKNEISIEFTKSEKNSVKELNALNNAARIAGCKTKFRLYSPYSKSSKYNNNKEDN